MIDVKKEIIAKHENGVRVSDLATQFGMAKSTICTILKNGETIREADVARGVTVIAKYLGSRNGLTFWRRNFFFNFSTPCI